MSAANLSLSVLLCLANVSAAFAVGDPDRWVPARWEGGPLELARRARDKAFVEDTSRREAAAGWYNPATLDLLRGTPINCLLVTFSAGAGTEVERRQQKLVKEYAGRAQERGIALLGIVYPGGDPSLIAAAAKDARLDGLVLDGDFPAGFAGKLETSLRAMSSAALVIPIARDWASVRTARAPLLAVEGVKPGARDLSDMGIRAGASAEPWIESNIWLVRSFRLSATWRPVWINQQPVSGIEGDYARSVADAAMAGGRWIVALDDDLRARLFHEDARGLAKWRRMAAYLQFAEDHAEWRRFVPYGNLAFILDTGRQNTDLSDEYLNLVARRQVPYRIIQRSQLSPASLAGFQAALAMDLAPATEAERKILCDFAEKGGLIVAGPSWGNAPKDESYTEVRLGKGRVAIYKDDPPNPESVAKDLPDLLEPEVIGFSVFNVPSAITYVSTSDSGKRVLIQLLDYADRPSDRVTIRFNGSFKTARLYTPEDGPVDLAVQPVANGRTELLIAKPITWGAVVLE
jgi:hypothetical protein